MKRARVKKEEEKKEEDELSFINDEEESINEEVDFDWDEVVAIPGSTNRVTRGTELREIKNQLKTKDKEIEVKDQELERLRKKLEAAGIEI